MVDVNVHFELDKSLIFNQHKTRFFFAFWHNPWKQATIQLFITAVDTLATIPTSVRIVASMRYDKCTLW